MKNLRLLPFFSTIPDLVFCLIVLSFFLGVSNYANGSPRVRMLEPWQNWARNPIAIPVITTATNILGTAASTVTITLTDGALTQEAAGASTYTNGSFTANVTIRKEVILKVEATALASMDIVLNCQPSWTPLSETGRKSIPKEYLMLVNRDLNADHVIHISQGISSYSNSWVIEFTESVSPQWRLDDRSDDPSMTAGDAPWAQLGPGKSLQTNRAAMSWNVSLGRLLDGLSAGRLSVKETAITRDIYTPKAIYYTASAGLIRDQVELVQESVASAKLRQVKAHQAFVDITTPSTNETYLNFYHSHQVGPEKDTNGYYTNIIGDAFVVWSLENPEPASTNRFNIVERRNGSFNTNEFVFTPDNTASTWQLRYGKGEEERLETREITFAIGDTTNRLENVDIRYVDSTNIAYFAQETYQLFPWGFELSETRVGPDGVINTADDLVTTATFYTNSNDLFNYRNAKTVTNPDGSWEKRIYDFEFWGGSFGTGFAILRPYGDSSVEPADATADDSVFSQYWDGTADMDVSRPPFDSYLENVFKSSVNLNNSWPWSLQRSVSVDKTLDYGGSTLPSVWIGNEAYSYSEDLGYGRWNHAAIERNLGSVAKIGWVTAAIYNSTNHTYTTLPEADPGDGPDWRYCQLETTTFAYYPPTSDYLAISQEDGTYLFHPLDFHLHEPYAIKNKSLRNTDVYHQGSLVLKETDILIGNVTNVTEEWTRHSGVYDSIYKLIYANDSLGHATNITRYDCATGLSRQIYSASYKGTNVYDGDVKYWEIDEVGTITTYTYDSQKRIKTKTKNGVTASGAFPSQDDVVTIHTYDACNRLISVQVSAGGLTSSNSTKYDCAGRITLQVDNKGLSTETAYELGGRRTIKTNPNGSTEIRENYLDGTLKSITGTGVINEFHTWTGSVPDGIDPFLNGISTLHTVYQSSLDSERVTHYGEDCLQRRVHISVPNLGDDQPRRQYITYNGSFSGDLTNCIYSSTVDGNVVGQRFHYNQWREQIGTSEFHHASESISPTWATPVFPEELPDLSAHRRIGCNYSFIKTNDGWFRCTTNLIYRSDFSATPTVSSITIERLNNFSDTNVVAEIKSWDIDTNLTVQTTVVDRSSKKLTQVTDVPNSTLDATNITVNGLLQSESTPTVSTPTRHYYDALGRETSVRSPLGFTASTIYDTLGFVQSTTDFTGKTTVYEYYENGNTNGAGQLKAMNINEKKTYHSYTLRGEPFRTWGDVPYPEERIYSNYGELATLHTYRGGSGWNSTTWPASPGTADTTTWTYDEPSGMLVSKIDNSNQSVSYTYTNGMVFTRTWARGVTVTNSYNGFGDLILQEYNDATPSVAYTNFSRTGLPQAVIDGTGTNVLSYDYADRLITVAGAEGIYDGITVTNHFNTVYGRDGLHVLGLSTNLTNTFGYDAYGRLGSVSNGIYSATYGYLPDSDLLQTTTFKSGSTNVMTTARQWDYGSRLRSIANTVDDVPATSHSYLYDELSRRRQAILEDGSLWKYDYNDRDELTSGKRCWQDWTPVAGQQFQYAYDTIGNRTIAKSGGDATGSNLRTETYTANGLNQYTNRSIPDKVDIIGAAYATATVTVNNNATYRKGEYYDYALSVTNSTYPAWHSVTNKAVLGANSSTNIGNLLVPPATQVFQYDLDGNITNDSVWVYFWDGENRLVQMTNTANVINAAKKNLRFSYDYMGRRTTKTVYSWNSGTTNWNSTPDLEMKFLYDGWNLIAILNSDFSLQSSFTWGNDLSGNLNISYGIGGLLLTTIYGDTNTNCFFGYDGNGNVSVLINAEDKMASARYEYDPYGRAIRATGLLALQNPFRFSSKYADDETGLILYPFRYYSPEIGRWLGRDPSTDQIFLHLYKFCNNNPIGAFDPDGRNVQTLQILAKIIADTSATIAAEGGIGTKAGLEAFYQMQNALKLFNALSPAVSAAQGEVVGTAIGSGLLDIGGGGAAGFATTATAGALFLGTAVGIVSYVGSSLFFQNTEAGRTAVDFWADMMVDFWASPD